MNFKATFCDPLKKDIIDLGSIEKNKILETFYSIPWEEHLAKMDSAKENEIHYSPSLEILNTDNNCGITLSVVDVTDWYIFYKRPKQIKRLFGLIKYLNKNYLSEVIGQSYDDALSCLQALIKNDLQFLEEKIK